MRTITFMTLVGLSLLLSACAMEAPYIDHEHGMASKDAFDRQIVHKDYAHAGKPVEGMAGIHAEPIMATYQQTFTEGFTKGSVDTTQTGSGSGSGSE